MTMTDLPLKPADFDYRFVRHELITAGREALSALDVFMRRHRMRVSPFEARQRVRRGIEDARNCMARAELIRAIGYEAYRAQEVKLPRTHIMYSFDSVGD
jgi:hypothetical protein